MKRITYFLSGALAALLISSATVSAFAAGGLITLNVQPAQVMVNGEVFQPKDAQGRDALVFTYNGTTYYYDNFGNLIHRELVDCEVQNYFYDRHDQLVKAEIFKKDGTKLLEIP